MKYSPLLALAAFALVGCDVDVSNPPGDSKTTVVNPPAKEEKHESNTTVVNPPAKQETKTESSTNVTNTPGGTSVQQSTETKKE